MESTVNTIYRQDYQAPGFIIDSLALRFELEPQETLVESEMQIQNLDVTRPLVLNGDSLTLVDVSLDDTLLTEDAYELTDNTLVVKKTPESFTLKIRTKLKPHENTALSGLYQSGSMYCTQCEAEGFRRITYFLDRPDVLTIYTTTIVADEKSYPVLLSNGNLIDKGRLDGGRHWVTWQDPFKKPSYLFALVAGDLAVVEDTFTTKSSREVALKLYVEHGNEDKCAHALSSLKKSMKWDEEVYGLEYDLDIFMIVAVSDFNMGAMENKGLNIFNAKYILASPETATDEDFANIEGVVAHEYFHNWTGNRVTCRDWFQLSLKEGLTVFRDQEFSRDMNSRDVNRIKDVDILRRHQFPEDAGPMAHPVRPDEYIEINNFYTSTIYNKGAEVIRMQHTLLGEEGFRRGMDLYFERHDGEAVTIDDFVSSMEDANSADFSQLKRWYSQAGTPEVRVKTRLDNGTLSVAFSQFCGPTPGQEEKLPFFIPIKLALYSQEGEALPIKNELFTLKSEKETLELTNVPEGAVLSLLRDFSAPVKLNFKQSPHDLGVLAKHEANGFARYEAMQNLLKHHVTGIIESLAEDKTPTVDTDFKALYLSILKDEGLDCALKALMLSPPSFEAIISNMKQVDVPVVMDAIDFLKHELGELFESEFQALYDSLSAEPLNAIDGEQFAKRHLKNVCLHYLSNASEQVERLTKQFSEATTMTEELGAFRLLVSKGAEAREKARDSFYAKWKADELVLDKWFSILAMAKHEAVVKDIRELMQHEAFEITNPNKVRALLGGFAGGNTRYFHTKAGYELLTEVVLSVDKLNPQTAARLVVPLTFWRRYTDKHAEPMKASLQKIIEVESLSKDVYEMVSKALVD